MDRLAAFRGTYRGVQAARKLLWLDRAQGVAQGRVWHAARDAEPAPHGARHLLGEVLDVGNALGAGTFLLQPDVGEAAPASRVFACTGGSGDTRAPSASRRRHGGGELGERRPEERLEPGLDASSARLLDRPASLRRAKAESYQRGLDLL